MLTAIWRSQSWGVVSRKPAKTAIPAFVDQQIHRVEPRVHRVGEFIHRLGVGDVDSLREHLGAEFPCGVGGFLQIGLVEITDGQARAAAGAQQGGGPADAAARAGNEHDAVAQILDVHQ
jgi:hypothetical protein